MEDRGFSDLLSTASSLLSSQSQSSSHSSSQSHSSTTTPNTPPTSSTAHHSRPASYEDVMGSAQVIMNAAKSKLHKGEGNSGEEFDMGQLAGAASTIIGAASHYGKLDNTAYGKYAQKAEDYLYSYETKHSKHNVASAGTAAQPAPAQSQGYASEQVHIKPTEREGYSQGYPSQGYGETAQGSRPAGNHAYSEPYQRKPAESQDYPTGYPPAGYPTSDSRSTRDYY